MAERAAKDGAPRVTHIVEAFGAGTLRVVQTIAEAQVSRGHEVCVLHGRRAESPREPRLAFPDEVRTVAVWKGRGVTDQMRAIREISSSCRDRPPDVVHAHSSFAGFAAAAARLRAPLIYTPHGYAFLRRDVSSWSRAGYRTLERMVAARCCRVVGCSESEARLARDLGARRVGAIANGIPEIDRLLTTPLTSADRVRRDALVMASGRIGPARRPRETGRILSELSDRARVMWVGDGPAADVQWLERRGVTVTGWVARDDVLRYLEQASVYVHWTAWDGLPLAVLEAIARDVVVIASDIPPNREVLGDRQALADPGEASSLARDVLADEILREDLLRTQRSRARFFTASRMTSEWIDLYESCASGARNA